MDTVYSVYTKAATTAKVTHFTASWTYYLTKLATYDIPMYFNSMVDIPYFNSAWAVVMVILFLYVFLKLYGLVMRFVGALVKSSMHVAVAALAYYCYAWKVNVFEVVMGFFWFVIGLFY